MAENTPGPKQLDSDNGSKNWGYVHDSSGQNASSKDASQGGFGEYGKGQALGDAQPGEGFHALDPNPIETPSVGGTNPPMPVPEQSGD